MVADKCEQINRLIEAGHTLFEVIEERDLPYKVLRRFIEKGLQKYESFIEDLKQLKNSVNNWIDYDEDKKREIKKYIENLGKISSKELLGHLALVFLLAWNMNRFQNCSNLTEDYLKQFGIYLNNNLQKLINRENFKQLKKKSIVNIEWEEVKPILEELNEILKNKPKSEPQNCFNLDDDRDNKQNEWVGAFKLGHVLLPKVIIPIDNPIAEALCFKNPGESFDAEIYKQFWGGIKKLLGACHSLENEDVLKKIDELFYVLFSLRDKVKWKIQKEFFGKEEGEIRNDLKRKRLIERIKNCFPIKGIQKISNKIMLIFDYDNNGRPIHISIFERGGRTYITIDIGFRKEDFNKSNKSALIQCIAKDLKLESFGGTGFKIGTLEEDEEKIFSKISKFLTKYFEISKCF